MQATEPSAFKFTERHWQHADAWDRYWRGVSSLLEVWDSTVLKLGAEPGVTFRLEAQAVRLVYKREPTGLVVPLVHGTQLDWYYRRHGDGDVILEHLATAAPPLECGFCQVVANPEQIPLTFTISNLTYTCPIFALLDPIKPRRGDGDWFNYNASVKYSTACQFGTEFDVLGSTTTSKFIPLTKIFSNVLTEVVGYCLNDSLIPTQCEKYTKQLFSGELDRFLSKRTPFQTTKEVHNSDDSKLGDVIKGFALTHASHRYNVAAGPPEAIRQHTLSVMSLLPNQKRSKNPRLIFRDGCGIFSTGKVTETDRAGQQKLLCLGVVYPRQTACSTWEEFCDEWHAATRDAISTTDVSILWGPDLSTRQLRMPDTDSEIAHACAVLMTDRVGLEMCRVSGPASWYVNVNPSTLLMRPPHVQMYCTALSKLALFPTVQTLDCSLYSLLFPFLNRSHPPKTLQAITKGLRAACYMGDCRFTNRQTTVPGSPLFMADWFVPARVRLMQTMWNDDDGCVVSKSFSESIGASTHHYHLLGVQHFPDPGVVLWFNTGRAILPGKSLLMILDAAVGDVECVKNVLSTQMIDGAVHVYIDNRTSIPDYVFVDYTIRQTRTYATVQLNYRQGQPGTELGDKLISLHGQKMCHTQILPDNHPLFDGWAQIVMSITSVKRLSLGEQLYSCMLEYYPDACRYAFLPFCFYVKQEFRNQQRFTMRFMRLSQSVNGFFSVLNRDCTRTGPLGQNTRGVKGGGGISIPSQPLFLLQQLDPYSRASIVHQCDSAEQESTFDTNGNCLVESTTSTITLRLLDMLNKKRVSIKPVYC